MKLEHIELDNFGSYYGRHDINLKVSAAKPLVIFVGKTGFGKTTIFDAINWGFYGDAYEVDLKKSRKRIITDFANETAIGDALRSGKSIHLSVSLRFTHNLVKYIKSQKILLTVKRDKDGTVRVREDSKVSSFKKINAKGDLEDINQLVLDEILPNNVKSYFLFDGDRIYNLANPGNSQEVKDAIYRVVDLEIIKNAEQHLADISKEYSRTAKREATGELVAVEEAYFEKEEFITQIKEDAINNKKELMSIQDQIANIESRLDDLPSSERLQAEKRRVVDRIVVREEEILNIKQQLRPKFAVASYKLITPQIQSLYKTIDAKRKKGDIPKHISETLISDIINITKECICGTPIVKGSKQHQKLLDRLSQEKGKSEKEHEIIKLLFDLKEVQDSISISNKAIGNSENRILELDEQLKSLTYELQEIEDELDKLPQEDVATLRKNLNELNIERDRLNRQEGEFEVMLKGAEKELKELSQERDKLGKTQKHVKLLQKRGKKAKEASQILEELYDQFAEDSRKEVEKMTIGEFKKFVFSSSNYDVALSKEYRLQVVDSNGLPALQRMSMGQSQCLSLAFITAISRVSQKNPPLVIDMPFSRLDQDVHAIVSKRLPNLSQQTILFLIPKVEWNEETKPILSNKAAHIYELSFDGNRRHTNIEKTK